jgi:hypothetical protein
MFVVGQIMPYNREFFLCFSRELKYYLQIIFHGHCLFSFSKKDYQSLIIHYASPIFVSGIFDVFKGQVSCFISV